MKNFVVKLENKNKLVFKIGGISSKMAEIGKKGQKLENLLKIRWKLANF